LLAVATLAGCGNGGADTSAPSTATAPSTTTTIAVTTTTVDPAIVATCAAVRTWHDLIPPDGGQHPLAADTTGDQLAPQWTAFLNAKNQLADPHGQELAEQLLSAEQEFDAVKATGLANWECRAQDAVLAGKAVPLGLTQAEITTVTGARAAREMAYSALVEWCI
jgi:hypothetical protein